MRRLIPACLAVTAVAVLATSLVLAQTPPQTPPAAAGQRVPGPNDDKPVAGGGIFVSGWQGTVDASSIRQGMAIKDAKFASEGANIRVMTGPAVSYWNPANTASGDYTVTAKFTEPRYMELNNHPHSYGIIIGANKMGTPDANYLYCVVYGDGKALVRGFGGVNPDPTKNGAPLVFTLMRDPAANPAVNKAADKLQPVTNTITWSVKGGKAECLVNDKSIASYDSAQLVGTGKLDSLNGHYGIRVTHNVEVLVEGFAKK
jgi:hypothetical protein